MTVSLRAPRPEDLAAIHALIRRSEQADALPLVTPREELDALLDDPHTTLADDARVVDAAGAIVGFGRVEHRPSEVGQARAFLLGTIDPDHRGQGLGRALFAWQLARGAARLRAAPAHLPRYLRTHVFEHERAAIGLYERAGLVPVRHFAELLRPLDPGDAMPAPAGFALAPWDPTRDDELRRLSNDAFADAWGHTPLDAAAWAHRLREPGHDLGLSWMAVAGDRVVGLALDGVFPGDEEVTGRRDGWIRQLAVARAWRQRGVGTALVRASLAGFRRAGRTHAILVVDGASVTGADRLYRALGFHPIHRMVQHQRELAG